MQPNPLRPMGRLIPLLFLFGAAPGHALQVPGPLVDTEWLANNLDKVVVLDVRRDANSFIRKAGGGGEVGGVQACGAKGAAPAVSGHIPGAALIEWKDLAVKQKEGDKEIYDQVPDKAAFEKLMQQSGVNADSAVVVVNPGDGAPAVADGTRLYWNLKYYGMDNVAVLDGGVAKWAEEKRKIEYGRGKPGKGNWQATAERQAPGDPGGGAGGERLGGCPDPGRAHPRLLSRPPQQGGQGGGEGAYPRCQESTLPGLREGESEGLDLLFVG